VKTGSCFSLDIVEEPVFLKVWKFVPLDYFKLRTSKHLTARPSQTCCALAVIRCLWIVIMLSIRLLGPFEVLLDGQRVAGFTSDKVRALLAYLAVESNQPHRRQALASLLWPNSKEKAARANLRRALSNLRTIIGDRTTDRPATIATRQTIQLEEGHHIWVDVSAFRHLTDHNSPIDRGAFAKPISTGKLAHNDIGQLAQMVETYRGPFLEGFSLPNNIAFEEWLVLKREQLRHQFLIALHRLAVFYEAEAEYNLAIHYARQQVEVEPWSEPAQRQLMRLLAYTGQRTAALDSFAAHRKTLAAELGIEPETATIQLYQQIRDNGLSPQIGRPKASEKDKGDFFKAGDDILTSAAAVGVVGQEQELQQLGEISALAGQLAHHYERTGQKRKAIAYYHRAGERAVRHSAHEAAVGYLSQALNLLITLPNSTVRVQQEIELLLALGVPLLSLKGYAGPEVQRTYDRARQLCQVVEAGPELIMALFWLASYYATCGKLSAGLALGEEMLAIVQEYESDELQTILAHLMTGLPLFHMGRFSEAYLHFQQAAAAYRPHKHQALASRIGQDPGIASLIWLGQTNIHFGYLEQAQQFFQEALAQTEMVDHPYTLAFSLLMAGVTPNNYFKRYETALLYARSLVDLAQKEGFGYFQLLGMFYVGLHQVLQALANGGTQSDIQIKEGIAQMEQILVLARDSGSPLGMSSHLINLAAVYGQIGRIQEGLQLLDEAQTFVNRNGSHYFEPELVRVKGELLRHGSSHLIQAEAAEKCFWQAIKIAQKQQARHFELRATVSLCRLWQQQGKRSEAHAQLTAIYSWFTEGFAMPDLQEAQELLAELSA
jgi:DNA-binding SARP family transcriptional activator